MFYPHLLPRTLAVAGLLALLTACSDKSDPQPPAPPDAKSLLGRQEWALTKVTATTPVSVGGGAPRSELLSVIPACERDNSFQLFSNGEYRVLANDLSCATEPATQTGTWSLSDDQKQLVRVFNGQTTTHELIAINDTSFVVRGPVRIQGVTYDATSQYTPNRNIEREQSLTAHSWHITEWKLTQTNGTEINRYNALQPCELDDFRQFSRDTTFRFDDNTLICTAGMPLTTSGTWSFGVGRRTFKIINDPQLAGTGRKRWTLVTVNATRMVLTRDAQPAYSSETIILMR
jgi:hypothetical protein